MRQTITLTVEIDEDVLRDRTEDLGLDGYETKAAQIEAYIRATVESNLQYEGLGEIAVLDRE